MKNVKSILLLVLIYLLVACGGGGGNPGVVGGKKTDTTSPGSPGSTAGAASANSSSNSDSVASDFEFGIDSRFIKNSGSDKATLTIKALDSNRAVVVGVPITVKLDSGIFTPTAKITDAKGVYSGVIEIGQDKSNRTIEVTMTMGNITKTTYVYVTGAVIAINLIPANPAPGAVVALELSARDSANNPIADQALTLSGNLGFSGSLTTDPAGSIKQVINAPTTEGSYKLIATGLGLNLSRDVQVTRGSSVPIATATVNSATLNLATTALNPNLNGSTTNRANLKVRFLDSNSVGIKNVRVQFRIISNSLPGESISVGESVVLSDENGEAGADYIAGSTGSPSDGVKIRACYKLSDFTDFELNNICSGTSAQTSAVRLTSTESLTVASKPVSIAISNYNVLEQGPLKANYIQKLLIQVTDSQGIGVQDAAISASVDITHYGKGIFAADYLNSYIPPPATQASEDSITPSATRRVWCTNEDTNRDGNITSSKDKNGDGFLQPEAAAISLSYIGGKKTTDANGQLAIQISWGQNYATWLAYTVRASTDAVGSEGSTSRRYITSYVEGDKDNGTFLTPPYGKEGCRSRN